MTPAGGVLKERLMGEKPQREQGLARDARLEPSPGLDKAVSAPEEFKPAGGPNDDLLTRNLKRVYEQVAAEPIPDDWIELLNQIERKAGKTGDGRDG